MLLAAQSPSSMPVMASQDDRLVFWALLFPSPVSLLLFDLALRSSLAVSQPVFFSSWALPSLGRLWAMSGVARYWRETTSTLYRRQALFRGS